MTDSHIFISYSRKDSDIVQRIITFLSGQGMKVWIDMQRLQPGEESWIKELEYAIENASAVVVVLSPDAKESPWVGNERIYAKAIGKPIFPILARGDEKSAVPIDLITYQRVDLRTEERIGLSSLHRALEHHLETVEAESRKSLEDAAIPLEVKAKQASQNIQLKIGNKSIFDKQNLLMSPPLARAAYSDRMSWILATMAKLAYIPFEENDIENAILSHNLKSGGFELNDTFNSVETNTQAFLAKSESFAVLVFRGTVSNSLNDVVTDVQANARANSSGKVNFGYNRAYASIANLIEEGLERISDLPLYVTGHSIGGALATIAAQQLESALGDQIAACYTFGSPRVGSVDFGRFIKSAIYRVVNAKDIVPMVPFLSMNYVHVGDVRFLGTNGGLHRMIPARRTLIILLEMIFRFGVPLIRDHAIDEYIRKLEKIALERNKEISVVG